MGIRSRPTQHFELRARTVLELRRSQPWLVRRRGRMTHSNRTATRKRCNRTQAKDPKTVIPSQDDAVTQLGSHPLGEFDHAT